ncbi:MAG: Flp pilus assembly complex ATPase component TadA [Syntrophobacterales bacterium]|jgi:general secretion pathway protein E|nr:Flp pilus assembly complex ATPase component TadA [Syntrophobacterales bacterium]
MKATVSLKDQTSIESFPGLSVRYLKENRVLPLRQENGHVLLAMADPDNQDLLSDLEVALGAPMVAVPAAEDEILEVIQAVYEPGSPMSRLVGDLEAEDIDLDMEESSEIGHLRDMAREAPIIQLVNLLVLRAIEMGASDIHLEPYEDDFRVRYRKDGLLFEAESPPKGLQAAVLSRLKIMARLDIAERRLPQDGRFRLKVKGHDIDFRVSTIPTLLGESMVIRILDREKVILDLNRQGFPPRELQQFDGLIHKPNGMILVTGPTGSGKTTTLYAALERINSPEKKIITVEDPVEYRLKGVTQMQVKPSIGLTFARSLRHIVRQDPEVILVGEIRDRETAEIAVHAALTGHLVFSTLNANEAPGAITRLIEMGVEDFLLASAILGILAQRLVRLICPECREALPPQAMQEEMDAAPNGSVPVKLPEQMFMGRGCPACAHTGYKGRTGIYELLLVDEPMRQLILKRADASTLRQMARQQGMRTLAGDGWDKVAQGLTTSQEVFRVTQE